MIFLGTSFATWMGWFVNEEHTYSTVDVLETEPLTLDEEDSTQTHLPNLKHRAKKHVHEDTQQSSEPSISSLPAHDPKSEHHLHGRYVLESESELLRLTLFAAAFVVYAVANKPAVLHEAKYKVECSGYDAMLFISNTMITLLSFYTLGAFTLPLLLGPSNREERFHESLDRARAAYRAHFQTWEFLYLAMVLGISFVGLTVIGLTGKKGQVARSCTQSGAIQSDFTFGFYIALAILCAAAAIYTGWLTIHLWHQMHANSKSNSSAPFFKKLQQVLNIHYLSVWVAMGVNLVFFLGMATVFIHEIVLYDMVEIAGSAFPTHSIPSSVLGYIQDGLVLGWILYHGVGLHGEIKEWKAKASDEYRDVSRNAIHNVVTGQSLLEWILKNQETPEGTSPTQMTDEESGGGGGESEDSQESDSPTEARETTTQKIRREKQEAQDKLDNPEPQPQETQENEIHIAGATNRDTLKPYSCGLMHEHGAECGCTCANNDLGGGPGGCLRVFVFGSPQGCTSKHCLNKTMQ